MSQPRYPTEGRERLTPCPVRCLPLPGAEGKSGTPDSVGPTGGGSTFSNLCRFTQNLKCWGCVYGARSAVRRSSQPQR